MFNPRIVSTPLSNLKFLRPEIPARQNNFSKAVAEKRVAEEKKIPAESRNYPNYLDPTISRVVKLSIPEASLLPRPRQQFAQVESRLRRSGRGAFIAMSFDGSIDKDANNIQSADSASARGPARARARGEGRRKGNTYRGARPTEETIPESR